MNAKPTAEEYSSAALLAVRLTLNLKPEARLTVMIDSKEWSPDYPVGLFSEVPIERLAMLIAAVQSKSNQARDISLCAIEKAMQHG